MHRRNGSWRRTPVLGPMLGIALAIGAILGAAPDVARAQGFWITLPRSPQNLGLSLQFRRKLTLKAKPPTLLVKISADSRFVLYVNARRVASGPSRGDLGHWRYESIDLAPYLTTGPNVLAAQVWSDGAAAPLAQVTTGNVAFFLEAEDSTQANLVDSGDGWEVRLDPSRSISSAPAQLRESGVPRFYAAGAPEMIYGALQHPDWNAAVSRAQGWVPAVVANRGKAFPVSLVRDVLPQQTYIEAPSGRVVRSSGATIGRFPSGPVVIPANSEATLLIDAGQVIAAYPELTASGGAGATVSLTYTEALYQIAKPPAGRRRLRRPGFVLRFTDRSTVDHGVARGLTDTFRPAGRTSRFAPFWWRAWRFIEIHVKTGAEPLTLLSLKTFETGYPFERRGRFVSNDEELNDIWRIGWHTATVDAHETYLDAYWEQLQYIADTRLQMLISYEVAGDPRLSVQALDAFDQSRVVEGIPQSAYPSTSRNLIPPFALLWINALHDYWMYEPDTAILKRTLPGARSVLDWYAPYLREDGILRMTPGWLFVDWRPTLSEMNPKNEQRPDSCVITILYYGALRDAADLETAVGDPAVAVADRVQAAKVRDRLQAKCWAADRQLFADTPAKTGFSQHANALAVLYDLVPKEKRREVLQRITTGKGIDAPDGIIPVTYYFAHYLAEAFDHAGMADRYLGMLQPWRDMVRRHFTTYPESSDPSRSDSHAWSAHPTVGLLTYVAGIRPAKPGFGEVRVEPHLGALTSVDAAMTHHSGLIEARYSTSAKGLSATIKLPQKLRGQFIWKGRTFPLRSGKNHFDLK